MRYWGRKPIVIMEKIIKDIHGEVVDPFGGSGSTILTTLRHGNKAIYLDINPYAWLVAFVNIIEIDHEEFMKKSDEVLKNLKETNEVSLNNDYLFYPNGKSFWTKRRVERVTELFPPDNFSKLYSILKEIDNVETTPNVKIALYGNFCSALFRSSKMNSKNGGSWAIPSYSVPKSYNKADALQIFSSSKKTFYSYFKRNKGYKLNEDVKLLLKNSLNFNYDENSILVTDPPYFDEMQYMELSFFYWAWLRESKFIDTVKEILGENIEYRINDEIIVNPKRNIDKDNYLLQMKEFLKKTSRMKEKYLIFHYDNEKLKNSFIELVKEEWENIKIDNFTVDNHRTIGARGGNKYILIYSK